MAEEGSAPRELVIKLDISHLKTAIYVLIVLALIGVIITQYVMYNDSSSEEKEETSNLAITVEEVEEETVAETAVVVEEVVEEEPEEEIEEEEEVVEEEEEETLPITGDLKITIDKINYEIKADDYARIMSVKFTIKNQKTDFYPEIKGYLTSDSEDIKAITLAKSIAGTSMTETSTKLTFGYNEIDTSHKLKLEVYNENGKLQTSTTKSFDTE